MRMPLDFGLRVAITVDGMADEGASARARIAAFEEAYARRRAAAALDNAMSLYPVNDLAAALRDLGYGFGTFFDWPREPVLQDDSAFEAANPDHPLAWRWRERRQRAAGFFLALTEGDPSLITPEALGELHRSLFDCSAAVRVDIARCLGFLGRPESAPHLERLLDAEPESEMVRQAVEWALHGDKSRPLGASDVHSSARGNGLIVTRNIGEGTIGLDVSSGFPEILTGDGRRAALAPDEVEAFQGGGLQQMVASLSEPEVTAITGDGFDSLRTQIPSGLSVLLDTTTVRNALRALDPGTPDPLALLDLATLSTAVVCFENVLVQPFSWWLPEASEFGIRILEQSRELVTGPLWSINVEAAEGLLRHDQRRQIFEAAWADFLGWPERIWLDFRNWDQFQHSPVDWCGVAASEYMGDLLIEGPIGESNAEFLAVQTMRSLVNHELASRLGVPYLATSLRSPVQCLVIKENYERKLVLDRLVGALGPAPAGQAVTGSDEPYALEYSAPFILGLILQRMRLPGDYWEILAWYRQRFRPLRERLQRDREDWDGRAGPYVRQMLQHVTLASRFAQEGEQAAVDASAALVAGALGGVAGASASLGMKLVSLLHPAERVRRCYHRWFRPELYLLTSLHSEAEGLRALDRQVESIWKCRWDPRHHRQLNMLRATSPAPFLRLGTLR